MTDEQGPVHYQISVTGRQVAAFFFLLLVALGLAFFFGMKTGAVARRDEEPRIAEAERPREVREDDSSLGFTRGEPTATPGTSAPPEPVAREEARATATPQPKATARPTPKPEPSPSVSSAPQTPASQTPSPKAAESKVADAKATPKAEPTKGGKRVFWVQVFATNNAQRVDDLARKLKEKGFKDVDVSPVPGKAGFFRVRLGPYADRAKADVASRRVMKAEPSIKKPIIGS